MQALDSALNPQKITDATDGPVISIEPTQDRMALQLHELWPYRELLYFLIWRDVKVRYKQTLIGSAWAIIQPLMTMIVFTLVFGRLANVPSDGVPYPVFSFAALVPWNFFAGALQRCTTSLVGQSHLILKVYFPRVILPLAATASGLVDFALAFIVLTGMVLWFGIVPTWSLLALPFFLLLVVLTAIAVGLWLSALNVRYRDVGHAVPFLIQLWMFASPIAYPLNLVPERWKMLYSINPMVGVVEGFRWALIGDKTPDLRAIVLGSLVALLILVGGLIYYNKVERTFADVV
jgi:lipopolysaccharide transport system permease protein